MPKDNTNYFIVAVVGAVAIIGLVVLYMYVSCPSKQVRYQESAIAGKGYEGVQLAAEIGSKYEGTHNIPLQEPTTSIQDIKCFDTDNYYNNGRAPSIPGKVVYHGQVFNDEALWCDGYFREYYCTPDEKLGRFDWQCAHSLGGQLSFDKEGIPSCTKSITTVELEIIDVGDDDDSFQLLSPTYQVRGEISGAEKEAHKPYRPGFS